uniref:Uncharacterized protein n=1 Tax=Utricularia reniformis TaxID=192314 RepID=A0A1Y0B298_9LAMI|nr:hypothetical protein AEK19_MT1313 [Utricularia reniformis]ART31514.1 hypothetical protein AEK19_MT1313 [Utricularia reniformis]
MKIYPCLLEIISMWGSHLKYSHVPYRGLSGGIWDPYFFQVSNIRSSDNYLILEGTNNNETVTTHMVNLYGPRQVEEKIDLMTSS